MDPKEHRDDLHIRDVIGKRYVKKHDASVADKWAVHVSVTCALADQSMAERSVTYRRADKLVVDNSLMCRLDDSDVIKA